MSFFCGLTRLLSVQHARVQGDPDTFRKVEEMDIVVSVHYYVIPCEEFYEVKRVEIFSVYVPTTYCGKPALKLKPVGQGIPEFYGVYMCYASADADAISMAADEEEVHPSPLWFKFI